MKTSLQMKRRTRISKVIVASVQLILLQLEISIISTFWNTYRHGVAYINAAWTRQSERLGRLCSCLWCPTINKNDTQVATQLIAVTNQLALRRIFSSRIERAIRESRSTRPVPQSRLDVKVMEYMVSGVVEPIHGWSARESFSILDSEFAQTYQNWA